jgi:hypothetical protein
MWHPEQVLDTRTAHSNNHDDAWLFPVHIALDYAATNWTGFLSPPPST